MAADSTVIALLRAIGRGQRVAAGELLVAHPNLGSETVRRSEEFFFEECLVQIYAGDTALHAAAFAYDAVVARKLMELGADVRSRNRRGSEPLHAATTGNPASPHWDPARQEEVILYLVAAGADPNATAIGGVTPLHRAVRNRCSIAVDALLRSGADPYRANANGSTAFALARWTTGRGGTGTDEARAEQQVIIDLLTRARR